MKKFITSDFSKSSNSLGFNPILQEICEMICQVIFSKTVCRIFLVICCSRFIINFVVKDFFVKIFFGTVKSPKVKFLETHLFQKFLHTVLKILSLQISWKYVFSKKKYFSLTWSFFHDCKTSYLGVIFLNKKLILYFFKVRLFNFNTILKICFKNLFK